MGIRDSGKQFVLFSMLGFFAGILYTNIVSKDYVAVMGIFNEYFLNQYVQTEVVVQEYMWYILRISCSYCHTGHLENTKRGSGGISHMDRPFKRHAFYIGSDEDGIKRDYLMPYFNNPPVCILPHRLFNPVMAAVYIPKDKVESAQNCSCYISIGAGNYSRMLCKSYTGKNVFKNNLIFMRIVRII